MKLKQGDQVQVVDGDHAGQSGKLVCLHRGWATIIRPDRVGIQTDAKHVQPAQHEATGD